MWEARSTMQRLRSVWLAIVGGSLILAFSVSATIGAPPTDTDEPRGQSISAFVHELIFGSEEETDGDEVVDEDEVADEDEESDEDLEEESDEEATSEDAEREVPEEFANHGECVSEAAQEQEDFEESDSQNRGEWVSTHARYTCWGLEPPDAEAEAADADEADADSDEDSDRVAAKAERKAAREAARAERQAAKAERSAARDAAKAERQVAHAERKAAKGH